MKVNVTNAGEERGVFDLTNTDSKTLQLALLLAVSCHCTVLYKRLRGSPAAALHLLKVESLKICEFEMQPKVSFIILLIIFFYYKLIHNRLLNSIWINSGNLTIPAVTTLIRLNSPSYLNKCVDYCLNFIAD